MEWFRSRGEAKVVIEAWRKHFNEVRPHSSLDYLTPHEFKQQHQPTPTEPSSKNNWREKAGAGHSAIAVCIERHWLFLLLRRCTLHLP